MSISEEPDFSQLDDSMQYDTRARLLAAEVLLADPEALGNDALETDLYLLRDQLTGAAGPGDCLALRPARGVGPDLGGDRFRT